MANFTGTIFSETLRMRTGLNIVTPTHLNYSDDIPFRVVYLLHGLSDAHTCWSDNTQLPLFSDEYHAMFIIPEVQRSFYTNMAHGLAYYDYLTKELPLICKKLFGISTARENTYIMGLSMGGYGALKCALDKPEQYAGCGAFSAACELDPAAASGPSALISEQEIEAIFGMEKQLKPADDPYALAEKCSHSAIKPQIYMSCGEQDFLHDVNIRFHSHISQLGFDCTYQEWPGTHDWYFWNESLHRALAHFFGKGR